MRYFILFFFTSCVLLAQHSKRILFKNATVHIGNGEVIENAYLSIKENKIDMVSNATNVRIDISQFDTTIDVFGKHIYPALIVPIVF